MNVAQLSAGEREGVNDEPLVTIVTPSYNQGRFIEETILSVLNQDYPAIEYLVFDGGSNDQTLDILAKYSDRLSFISEKDRGQAHAINKGFQKAKGEIVAFLNSDDTYLPGAVSAAVRGMAQNPFAPFLYGQGYHIDENNNILERYPTEPFSDERLRETCFLCQPTVFIRKAALEKAGYLDERLHFCLDYELWIRLARLGEPIYLNRYLANSRLYETNKTLGQRRRFHWEIAGMWKRVEGRVPTSWVFGLAHAIIETRLKLDRSKPYENALFILILSAISSLLFLRLNGGMKREERREIQRWTGFVFKGMRSRLLRSVRS
jgi:glycosyltransferase involved in cell wall biosynthesis